MAKASLVVKKSFSEVLKTRMRLAVGRMIYRLYKSFEFFQSTVVGYDFTKSRMNPVDIIRSEKYVDNHINYYKFEQNAATNIEKLSEYYLYSKIEEFNLSPQLNICNIGCFYCGADYHFLKKHPKSTIYGLDFGNLSEINKDIKLKNLKLFSGYPLKTLERFVKTGKPKKFDYVLFTRTATIININELISYMKILSKLAKNICFLEVVKLRTYPYTKVDINKIDLMHPVKMYTGMYIHNYPALLKKFGYKVVESSVFPASVFEQTFTGDHYFVYVHGRLNSKAA